ncbi:MAG: pilus assembly protein N-terminal domain-containing protein, partial [Planctomycetota bacterium]
MRAAATLATVLFLTPLAASAAQSDAPSGGTATAAPTSDDPATGSAAPMLVGHHDRILLDRDVRRVAVADPAVLRAEVLDSREILVTALSPGVSSLVVWFEGGEPLERIVTVQRDLSLLSEIMASIDGSIEVEVAPGRDAVILRGVVANSTVRDAAQAAATAYVSSGRGGVAVPLLATDENGEAVAQPGVTSPVLARRRGATVINLLRVSELPAALQERIEEAVAPLADGVTVRRIQVGPFPDDALDVFLLEGEVPDQVALTRVLFVASRAVLGASGGTGANEVRALADEAGALTQVRNVFGAGNGGGGGGGGGQGQGLQSISSSALGGGGGQQAQQLANRIGSQVGRAKVVEAADGRILSTIRVDYLPLVQVDVRLYEVSRGKLRSWRNELTAGAASFDQFPLLPAPESVALQGPPQFEDVGGDNVQVGGAQGVPDDELQGLLGFLNGTLSGRGQAVAGGFLIDNLFQVLVEEDVARSLSNPSLTVLSGELAQFQVGGQIPVPVAVTVGGGTDQILNGVDFRDFGIDLAVRPL